MEMIRGLVLFVWLTALAGCDCFLIPSLRLRRCSVPRDSTLMATAPRDQHHKLPRLYLPADLRAGQLVDVDDENTNYIKNVMRLRDGEQLRIFNERHGEYLCSVSMTQHKRQVAIQASILEQIRPPLSAPAVQLCLLFAPIKRDRLKLLVEKATELGVHRLMPVRTQHTNHDMGSALDQDSLHRVMMQSVEQCERLSLPVIEDVLPFEELIAQLKDKEGMFRDSLILVCRERSHEGAAPLLTVMKDVCWDHIRKIFLCVGPEGGFADAEFDQLAPHVIFVSLGEQVLRAETAALAALAIVAACIDAQQSG